MYVDFAILLYLASRRGSETARSLAGFDQEEFYFSQGPEYNLVAYNVYSNNLIEKNCLNTFSPFLII